MPIESAFTGGLPFTQEIQRSLAVQLIQRVYFSIYATQRLILILVVLCCVFFLGYFFPVAYHIGRIGVGLLILGIAVDILLLYLSGQPAHARRQVADRLSNGDENPVQLYISNRMPFLLRVGVIDEIPYHFQVRNFYYQIWLHSRQEKVLTYRIRPTTRGQYDFGVVNLFLQTVLGLLERRLRVPAAEKVAVYPSYVQLRKYELLATSNRLTEVGIKRMRGIGQSMEFDRIRQYSLGDELRTINWKATARRTEVMVNQYQEERSQNVYSIIDMGRNMKMPFEGLTLLDYAINSALVLSSIALHKQDKAGLLTFSHINGGFLPAGKKILQMTTIQEMLYAQRTDYLESDFDLLYTRVRESVRQRSLLMVYTNFESVGAMSRNLVYLRRLAQQHVVVVVFFQNTELHRLITRPAETTLQIYQSTLAEKFDFEKKLIARKLRSHGIHSLLTHPSDLTVNAINKYLELKSRGIL
jgi:uncharacterized protein (DUF58 family)